MLWPWTYGSEQIWIRSFKKKLNIHFGPGGAKIWEVKLGSLPVWPWAWARWCGIQPSQQSFFYSYLWYFSALWPKWMFINAFKRSNSYLFAARSPSHGMTFKVCNVKLHCKPFHCKNCRFPLWPFSHCSFTAVWAVIDNIPWNTVVYFEIR